VGVMTTGLALGQRWSAARKREVVLRMLLCESVEALSRELGVEIYRLEKWRDKGLSGIDAALKGQAIYGKVLRSIEEVRRAVGKFVKDYNAPWRVERDGFVSPRQARQAWFAALSQRAA
jgi:transposase